VSCYFFVPIPKIVVKSHQQLESILPFLLLPLSITSALTTLPEPEVPPISSSPSSESKPPLQSLDSVLILSADIDNASSNSPTTTDKRHFDTYHYNSFHNKPTKKERIEGLGYYYPIAPTAPLHPERGLLYLQEQQQFEQQLQLRERLEDLDQTFSSYLSSSCQDLSISPRNPFSTACIRISLKPKITLRFLDLGFSLKTHSNSSSNGSLPNTHTMPRLLPVRFTFPFPPHDQPFPSSVQVTGDFEDWTRSHKAGFLHRNEQEGRFETELEIDLGQLESIELSGAEEQPLRQRKVLFKFVLDGHNWVTDPGQALERDHAGNLNNVCFVEGITPAKESEQQQQQQPQEPQEQTLTESATIKTLVNSQTYDASSKAGDAQPSQDVSTASSAPILGDDDHDGDGDYGVAIVQHEAVTISRKNSSEKAGGEARPTVDASVAEASTSSSSSPSTPMLSSSSNSIASSSSLAPSTVNSSAAAAAPTISISSVNATGSAPISLVSKLHPQATTSPTTAVSTSAPQFPSDMSLARSNKRKSGFWRKFKKIIS